MLPLLLLAAFQQVFNQLDILMLGWFTDSASIGVYSVASRAAQASIFAVAAINTIFAPTISVLYGRGDAAGLQEVVTTASWWSLISALAFAVPMFVLAGPLLSIFGESFVTADTSLRILLIGQVVNAGLGSVVYIMTMTGQERPAVFILGAILVGNFALNLALIPEFGIEGAAVAKAGTLIVWKMAMAMAIWRRIKVVPSLFG